MESDRQREQHVVGQVQLLFLSALAFTLLRQTLLIGNLFGVAGLVMGKNYLDYSVLAHEPELGIFPVETGVLITVSGIMTALFYAFVERGR